MSATPAPRARRTVWAVRLAAVGACVIVLASALRPVRPAPKSDSAASDPARVEVRLGYFPNLAHAQAVLAVDSGELARALAPNELVTRTFNAGPTLIESLFAGEIDIGYVGPGPAVNAFIQSRGRGIRVIAGASADGVAIVARAGSGVRTLADLKGRRIATPQLGNTQDISARHWVIVELGADNADRVIPVPNAEQAGMMQRGEIDASWAVEPWASRLVLDTGGVIVAQEKDLWPGGTFALALVVVSPEFLAAHPDIVAEFLAVHRDWTERLAADPNKQATALADALERLTGKRLPDEVVSQALTRIRFTTDPLPDSIRTFAERAASLGMARGVPDVSVMIDTSALEQVLPPSPPPPPASPTPTVAPSLP